MHGREPRLPLDEILNIDDGKTRKDYAQYIKTWQAQMDEAWKIANEKSAKRKTADRRRWNKTARLTELQCGDRVLVKNLTPREGPGKLRNYWEDTIHTVTRIVGDTNVVYEVQAEGNARARKRVLHRNMLMPCQELILNKDDKAIKTKKKTKQPATVTNARNQPTEPVENIDIDSSDSEEEYVLQIRNNETVDAQPLQNDDNIQVDENVENDNEAQEIDEGEGDEEVERDEINDMDDNNDMDDDSHDMNDSMDTDDSNDTDGNDSDGNEIEQETVQYGKYMGNHRSRKPIERTTYDTLGTPRGYNADVSNISVEKPVALSVYASHYYPPAYQQQLSQCYPNTQVNNTPASSPIYQNTHQNQFTSVQQQQGNMQQSILFNQQHQQYPTCFTPMYYPLYNPYYASTQSQPTHNNLYSNTIKR